MLYNTKSFKNLEKKNLGTINTNGHVKSRKQNIATCFENFKSTISLDKATTDEAFHKFCEPGDNEYFKKSNKMPDFSKQVSRNNKAEFMITQNNNCKYI